MYGDNIWNQTSSKIEVKIEAFYILHSNILLFILFMLLWKIHFRKIKFLEANYFYQMRCKFSKFNETNIKRFISFMIRNLYLKKKRSNFFIIMNIKILTARTIARFLTTMNCVWFMMLTELVLSDERFVSCQKLSHFYVTKMYHSKQNKWNFI